MEIEEKEQQFNLWIKNKIKLDNSLNTSHIIGRVSQDDFKIVKNNIISLLEDKNI